MSNHYVRADGIARSEDVQALADELAAAHARTRLYVALINLIAVIIAAITAFLTAKYLH
jgi:hypothetical protein